MKYLLFIYSRHFLVEIRIAMTRYSGGQWNAVQVQCRNALSEETWLWFYGLWYFVCVFSLDNMDMDKLNHDKRNWCEGFENRHC